MALHGLLWSNLINSYDGKLVKVLHVRGSVNYRLMDAGARALLDPKDSDQFLQFLQEMKTEGHLALRGPNGVAYECGAPGMHWSYNIAPALANLIKAIKRGEAPGSEIRQECLDFLVNEVGLDSEYEFRGRVVLPCPRVKDEKDQQPMDGTRDEFLAVIRRGGLPKKQKNWDHPQMFVLRLLRDLFTLRATAKVQPLTATELLPLRVGKMPRLLLPIEKVQLTREEGYWAFIKDTPEARKIMGKDCCNWVYNGPDGIKFGVDWEPIPGG